MTRSTTNTMDSTLWRKNQFLDFVCMAEFPFLPVILTVYQTDMPKM